MAKFKLGDKVIGNAAAIKYNLTRPGTIWYVTKDLPRDLSYNLLDTLIITDEMSSESFWVDPDCFDLEREKSKPIRQNLPAWF